MSRRSSDRDVQKVWHDVPRISLPIPGVREFQSRYESAVPHAPVKAMDDLVSRGAPWSEMIDLIERSAPNGFLIYFRLDFRPLMGLAGDCAACIGYLMGNHVIGERMFRHDPRAMLYEPFRTVIWEDKHGAAWFTVEQPSKQLLHLPQIADVGIELDQKLAALLDELGVAAPSYLRGGGQRGSHPADAGRAGRERRAVDD